MLYFKGYKVPYKTFLTGNELNILNACEWMVKTESTLRVTAAVWNYSTTTFWRRIHNDYKELCPDLYEKVNKQIIKNIHHKRNRRSLKWRQKK